MIGTLRREFAFVVARNDVRSHTRPSVGAIAKFSLCGDELRGIDCPSHRWIIVATCSVWKSVSDKQPHAPTHSKGLVFGSASAFAMAAPRRARATNEARRGGTLNIVIQPEPPILVSLTHTAGPTTRVSPKLNEGLLSFDLGFNPRPQLAIEWNIRRGVKWHDGKDFSSAHVAYSIELLKQHHPRGRGTLASVRRSARPTPMSPRSCSTSPRRICSRAIGMLASRNGARGVAPSQP